MSPRPIALVLALVAVTPVIQAQEKPVRPAELKVLDRFVGVWDTTSTSRPSRSAPDGSKGTAKESTVWMLNDRFVVGRVVAQPDGVKGMWFIGYDPKTKKYPYHFFNSKGVLGAEWSMTWEEASSTFTGKSVNAPKAWSSGLTNQFPDKATSTSTAWMKDEAGKLVFETDFKKTRAEGTGEKILEAWSKLEKPAVPLPAELKPLDRLAGNWDVTSVFKVAEWTPKELRLTSKVTRTWVLDGHFLQDTSEVSDGSRSLALMTYDPQRKAYRTWWFSSEGFSTLSTGTWDGAAETFSYTSEIEGGFTTRTTVRFKGKDQNVWTVVIKNAEGKVFFDGEWDVKRR